MGNLLQQLALLGALMLSGEQGLGHGVPWCFCCMGCPRGYGSPQWGWWRKIVTGSKQGPQGCGLGITWQCLLLHVLCASLVAVPPRAAFLPRLCAVTTQSHCFHVSL